MSPEKAIIKCDLCEKEFDGQVPDTRTWVCPEISHGAPPDLKSWEGFDIVLLKDLRLHHKDTGTENSQGEKTGGHRYFSVFLPDNRRGLIQVFSGIVTYDPKL